MSWHRHLTIIPNPGEPILASSRSIITRTVLLKKLFPSQRLFLGHFDYESRNQRQDRIPTSDEVLGDFDERRLNLSEQQAVAEAKRCMSCGMCFECDNCVIFCPPDAVFRVKKDRSTTGRYVDTDYDRCIGCHICADVCPTGYIDMGLGK